MIEGRLVTMLTLILMLVMTPITLWLAIANPISDCGCFGDAVVLTNWQTLAKNVVLLILAIIVKCWPLEMMRFISRSNQWIVINYSALFIVAVSGWSLYDLPYFDFRPYHVGTDLRAGWLKMMEGEESPYSDFFVERLPNSSEANNEQATESEDITEPMLLNQGYTFLLVSPHLEQANDSQLDRINEVAIAVDVWNTLVLQSQHSSRLGSCRNGDFSLSIMSGHFERCSQYSLWNGEQEVVHQVHTITHQFWMRFLVYENLQVSVHTVSATCTTFALEVVGIPFHQSCWQFHLHLLLTLHDAFAVTMLTFVLDDLAFAVTGVAHRLRLHDAQHRLAGLVHHTLSVTSATSRFLTVF